jgi:hypothetical protein
LQTKVRVARQEHCPISEFRNWGEGALPEYELTLRVGSTTGDKSGPVETAALNTVAAFSNSWGGGRLLLDVAEDEADKGIPFGLGLDYANVHKDGKDDADMFQLMLTDVLKASMGAAAISNVTTQVHTVDGNDICRVHIKPCGFPVNAKVTELKKGQHVKAENFYTRINNGTHKFIDDDQKQKYIANRWPSK